MPRQHSSAPFTEDTQLCTKLSLTRGLPVRTAAVEPHKHYLPGYPGVSLDSTPKEIAIFIRDALNTPRLHRLYPYLWLVATQSSAKISPLHEQIVRGRSIVIAENPELHLLWVEERVFLKPIPEYLLSFALWEVHLPRSPAHLPPPPPEDTEALRASARASALGFLRSYYYLIRHESDFRIAERENLIPSGLDWPKFHDFICKVKTNVTNEDVSPRYKYGQLRLTRLNFWAKFVLGEWQFQKVAWEYSQILSQFIAPFLVVIGVMSVVLSAMQVGAQVRPDWEAFIDVSAWFSVVSLLFAALLSTGIVAFTIFLLIRELLFALKGPIEE
ncbi:hypothetical protein AUP68_12130 [Ilyonectria robusta]